MELSFLNPFGVEVHWDMSLVVHEYIHGSWIVCDFVLYDLGHFNLVIFHNALKSWEGRFLVMLLKIPNNWPNKNLSWISILGHVWYSCLNNSFHCSNNTTRIFISLFHSHVFLQNLNNVTKTTLPNGPLFSKKLLP